MPAGRRDAKYDAGMLKTFKSGRELHPGDGRRLHCTNTTRQHTQRTHKTQTHQNNTSQRTNTSRASRDRPHSVLSQARLRLTTTGQVPPPEPPPLPAPLCLPPPQSYGGSSCLSFSTSAKDKDGEKRRISQSAGRSPSLSYSFFAAISFALSLSLWTPVEILTLAAVLQSPQRGTHKALKSVPVKLSLWSLHVVPGTRRRKWIGRMECRGAKV